MGAVIISGALFLLVWILAKVVPKPTTSLPPNVVTGCLQELVRQKKLSEDLWKIKQESLRRAEKEN